MDKTIAIDIVLLPPKEIWEWAVQLSKKIYAGTERKVLLDQTHLPHITLVQAYIKQEDMDGVFSTVEKIAKDCRVLFLTVEEIVSEGGWIAFRIDETEKLIKLHTQLINAIQEYEQKINKDVFIRDPDENFCLLI